MTGERGAAGLAATVVVVGGGTGGNKADRGLSDVLPLNPALFLLPIGAVKVELGRTRA